MVIPRKWKVVAGAMSATVALGATAAIAEEASSSGETKDEPVLSEVVDVSELPAAVDLDSTVLQTELQDDTESPFDNVTAGDDSVSPESESLESDSAASEESTESQSLPSEESEESAQSAESQSVESVSVESVSVDE